MRHLPGCEGPAPAIGVFPRIRRTSQSSHWMLRSPCGEHSAFTATSSCARVGTPTGCAGKSSQVDFANSFRTSDERHRQMRGHRLSTVCTPLPLAPCAPIGGLLTHLFLADLKWGVDSQPVSSRRLA